MNIVLVVLSLIMLFSQVLLGLVGITLSPVSNMIISGLAILVLIAVTAILVVTKLYVRAKPNAAFVRTGMGGLKVVKDGGALVIPILHQIVWVNLETIRLEVNRSGKDALIVKDMRADIQAEFFVRVQPDESSIQSAARSLGDKKDATNSIAALLIDKLVSALRTAAAVKTLAQLNSEREEFVKEVTNQIKEDLAHNGFTLETVTISALDQTDVIHFKATNTFDAQGLANIAQITESNLTKKNEAENLNKKARKEQDVKTALSVFDLEKTQAEAAAKQKTEIAIVTAEQEKQAKEKVIEAERSVDLANVERMKTIEIAKREQEKAAEIAAKEKERSIVDAEKLVEVAKRLQQEAIAQAEAKKALEEAKQAQAEASRAEERQKILTVEEVAKANRDKTVNVTKAEAEAQQNLVTAQKQADADAYKITAQAEARKASADADAEAIKKKAEAEAEAVKRKAEADAFAKTNMAQAERSQLLALAEGTKAQQMVPVEVAEKQVAVDKSRVEDVLKPELEAREKSGKVAQEFEIEQMKIKYNAEISVAYAQALGSMAGKFEATLYGTPEQAADMFSKFGKGFGLAQTLEGMIDGSGEGTRNLIQKAGEAVESLLPKKEEK
jgi:flotillin